MTQEEVTDYVVEKHEKKHTRDICDNCGRVIDEDEPNSTIVINPTLHTPGTKTIDEVRRERAVTEMAHHRTRYIDSLGDRRTEELKAVNNSLRKAIDGQAIEGVTLFEDTCAECIQSLSSSSLSAGDIGPVPDVTVSESKAKQLRSDNRKAWRAVKQAKRKVQFHTVTMACGAAIATATFLYTVYAAPEYAVPVFTLALFHAMLAVISARSSKKLGKTAVSDRENSE